jgi:hypothetical protein
MRTQEEMFKAAKEAPVYDADGLSINTVGELFAHVFREAKFNVYLIDTMTETEKLRLLKMHIDSLDYNLKVAMAGLKRERREKERLQQLKLLLEVY